MARAPDLVWQGHSFLLSIHLLLPPPLLLTFMHQMPSGAAGHRVSALMGASLGWELAPNSPQLYAALLPPETAKAQALRCAGVTDGVVDGVRS